MKELFLLWIIKSVSDTLFFLSYFQTPVPSENSRCPRQQPDKAICPSQCFCPAKKSRASSTQHQRGSLGSYSTWNWQEKPQTKNAPSRQSLRRGEQKRAPPPWPSAPTQHQEQRCEERREAWARHGLTTRAGCRTAPGQWAPAAASASLWWSKQTVAATCSQLQKICKLLM